MKAISISDILQQLARGPRSAKEVCNALQISQATFSRLISKMKSQVKILGKGRATLYVALREVRRLTCKIPVFQISEQGACNTIGELIAIQPEGYIFIQKKKSAYEIFRGAPYFLSDIRPQGFLGRSFSHLHPDLKLPNRLIDWSEDDFIDAIARRGEDAQGDLIVGKESFERYQQALLRGPSLAQFEIRPAKKAELYVKLAANALQGSAPGSSAAGEQPKFTTILKEQRKIKHVLVKFSPQSSDAGGARWRDLLISESIALKILTDTGISASQVSVIEKQGQTFLEVKRFDRIEENGRAGLISMGALDDEWFGSRDNWIQNSMRLFERGAISDKDASTIKLLYSFGKLIANSDMHFGNISFFWNVTSVDFIKLAPVYDMLPMLYAPIDGKIVKREFKPSPPNPDAVEEWSHALPLALKFWQSVSNDKRISVDFKKIAKNNYAVLSKSF
jgi:hypothetical protein